MLILDSSMDEGGPGMLFIWEFMLLYCGGERPPSNTHTTSPNGKDETHGYVIGAGFQAKAW